MTDVSGMTRTWKDSVDHKYGVKLGYGHILVPWLFKFAGDIITRCRIDSTGRTPYEKLKGKKSSIPVVQFGEKVDFQRLFHSRDKVGRKLEPNFAYGIYVGIDDRNNQRICITEEGVEYTRSIKRISGEGKYDVEFLSKVRGTP